MKMFTTGSVPRIWGLLTFGLVLMTGISTVANALSITPGHSVIGEIVYWDFPPTDAMEIRRFPGSLVIGKSDTGEIQGILEYGLASLPFTASDINSATLSVVRGNIPAGCLDLDPCPTPDGVALYGFVGDGVFTDGDFDAGSLLASVSPFPALGDWMEFDVTAMIMQLMTNGDGFAGFNFRSTSDGAASLGTVRNAQGQNVNMPPVLEIIYGEQNIPEPATLVLMGLGLAGLGFTRRKKA